MNETPPLDNMRDVEHMHEVFCCAGTTSMLRYYGDCCWCGVAACSARSVVVCAWGSPSSTSASTSCLSRPVLPRRLWRVVGWVGFLLDMIGGVEIALREGYYPASALVMGSV
jgi:hypothetical protein